jgi:hypothetical protein
MDSVVDDLGCGWLVAAVGSQIFMPARGTPHPAELETVPRCRRAALVAWHIIAGSSCAGGKLVYSLAALQNAEKRAACFRCSARG